MGQRGRGRRHETIQTMAMISADNLVDAVRRVEAMTFHERVLFADAVHASQPNLFFSVFALKQYGTTMAQLEVVLNILLVFFEAMRTSGRGWELVTEDVQERCLARVSGRVRFIKGLTPKQQTEATVDAVAGHPEKQLLAYVFGEFKEHELLGIKTETEKMMMLSALNLVECVAETAPRASSRIRLFRSDCRCVTFLDATTSIGLALIGSGIESLAASEHLGQRLRGQLLQTQTTPAEITNAELQASQKPRRNFAVR
jgi:hypothetical protein